MLGASKVIELAHHTGSAWGYSAAHTADDMHSTAWAVTAMRLGYQIDALKSRRDDALGWMESMIAPDTGLLGYRNRGGPSSILEHGRSALPAEPGAETGAIHPFGHSARLLLGREDNLTRLGWSRTLEIEPRRQKDLCLWFHGATFLALLPDELRTDPRTAAWTKRMVDDLIKSQTSKGQPEAGSWAPNGKWGSVGGRVYSTSMALLALLAPGRYTRDTIELRALTRDEQRALEKLRSLSTHADLGVRETAASTIRSFESD